MTTDPSPILRPLGVGERIDGGIKLYRRNFRTLVLALSVVAVPVSLIDAALSWWRAAALNSDSTKFLVKYPDGSVQVHWSALDPIIGSLVLSLVLGFLIGIPARAISYRVFSDAYLGRRSDWYQSLGTGLAKIPSMLWIAVLVDGALLLAVGAFTVFVLAVAHLGAVAVLILLIPGTLLGIFYVWWLVVNHVAVPAMMVEDVRGTAALRRSWALLKNSWWSAFGTIILADLLVWLLLIGTDIAFGLIARATTSAQQVGPHAFVQSLLSELVNALFLVPFVSSIATVLYIDMRVRKEGLDLALLTDGLGGIEPGAYDFLPAPKPGPWQPAAPQAVLGAPPRWEPTAPPSPSPSSPDPWPPPPPPG